jgi:thymidine kinase
MEEVLDHVLRSHRGWIALVYGPMFAKKSTVLIDELHRAETHAKLNVQAFKPVIDNRYGNRYIVSHDGLKFPATEVKGTSGIVAKLDSAVEVIGISESQFFDPELIDFCLEQRQYGRKIILEGLLTDFRKKPFPFKGSRKTMTDLLVHVDFPIPRIAFCYSCGEPAMYTMRTVASKAQVLVGGKDAYVAACYKHHQIPKLD